MLRLLPRLFPRGARAPLSRNLSSSAAEEPRVLLTRDAATGVATVTLNRGGKLNALDLPMFRQLAATARELISDKSVRAVVVCGAGRGFCAGIDAKSVAHPLRARENAAELLHRPEGAVSNLAQDVAFLWRKVPAPVIAVTHGVCFGGGLQIALGADMRVTSPTCRFSVMEAKWGIIPDMSLTVTIRELVPKDVALELVMTGRVFEAEEALKLGLVTRIADDPLVEGQRLAREIATRSPDAVAAAKRLLHAAYTGDEARALDLEMEVQKKLLGGWNMVAASAKALGVPPMLRPGFANRSGVWDAEADQQAEEELEEMLGGAEKDSLLNKDPRP